VILNVLFLILGSTGLYFGAEWLVRGAAGLARLMGIRPLAIGLTIVAYGTSAPELVVSGVSAYQGKSALALGNVVGSNIANIGLILGITTIIAPPLIKNGLMRRELPVLLAATAAVPLLLWDGVVSRFEGAILLASAFTFSWVTLRALEPHGERPSRAPAAVDEQVEAEEGAPPERHGRLALAGLTFAGLAVLSYGGKLFVDGAVGLALAIGLSERIVGLTIVAMGTSLPELAASLVAALRGHSEIAVGNVLGSNIFNICLILGSASLIHPIEAQLGAVRLDLLTMGVLTVVCTIAMRTARKIQRFEGALLVTVYSLFLIVLASTS
jgi:cation:H+ antiporter